MSPKPAVDHAVHKGDTRQVFLFSQQNCQRRRVIVSNREHLLRVATGKLGAEEGANSQTSRKQRTDSKRLTVERLSEKSLKNPWKVNLKYYLGLQRTMAAYNLGQRSPESLLSFSISPSIQDTEGQKQPLTSRKVPSKKENSNLPYTYLYRAGNPHHVCLLHTITLTLAVLYFKI